ncbi:anti-silencing asf1 family protein [Cystoisospora suis]|uniref:Anti-silencing asf1 family protein n=1 Tax=Cystoisospora suis TaxID=483139 RepID=A0A2C6KM11_9APIC|nr:anti-silencing asf1 family protein [Cystoisospora suis]
MSPFVFEICFEALAPLKEDLEWKVVYVGSSECAIKRKKKKSSSSSATSSCQEDVNAKKGSSSSQHTSTTIEEEEGMETRPPSRGVCEEGDKIEREKKTMNGTASSEKKDEGEDEEEEQGGGGDLLLDSVMLGPIERGVLAFEFAVNPPDYTKMRDVNSVVGMQAVLVCALYKQQEFIRIGYYLNNAYSDSALRENPPDEPLIDQLVRCIVDEPRVTRFPIQWDESPQLLLSSPVDAPPSSSSTAAVDTPEEKSLQGKEETEEGVKKAREEGGEIKMGRGGEEVIGQGGASGKALLDKTHHSHKNGACSFPSPPPPPLHPASHHHPLHSSHPDLSVLPTACSIEEDASCLDVEMS